MKIQFYFISITAKENGEISKRFRAAAAKFLCVPTHKVIYSIFRSLRNNEQIIQLDEIVHKLHLIELFAQIHHIYDDRSL